MKNKSIELTDYGRISEEVRSLIRAEAEFRGQGITFALPHTNRYWEYGSALYALREAGIAPPARILDVGCGHGPLGPWLAKLGYRVDEIDPSPNVASRAMLRSALADCDYAFAATPLLDFKPGSPYDAVCCISVLEHIPTEEQMAAWAKLSTLVAHDGLLILTVDYGRADASNAAARETIYTEDSLKTMMAAFESLGFTFWETDTTYHGDEVFDYTFFRLIARKDS